MTADKSAVWKRMGRLTAAQIIVWFMNLTSASQVRDLLIQHGLRPKKRLGQNFLIDRNILEKIISAVPENLPALEIGPGLGVVTLELAKRVPQVVCVEMDQDFLPILTETLEGFSNTEIVLEDFLRIDLTEFLKSRKEDKWSIVGNLPYYITSPIIGKVIESKEYVSEVILMMQREVANRLMAQPSSSDYGALTLFVQFHTEISVVCKASRNVFLPPPEVDSEVIKLKMLDKPRVNVYDEKRFFNIVKSAFGKRRKNLQNALGQTPYLDWDRDISKKILDLAQIDINRRGETLSIDEFATITNISKDF